jgi:hypothetical protein
METPSAPNSHAPTNAPMIPMITVPKHPILTPLTSQSAIVPAMPPTITQTMIEFTAMLDSFLVIAYSLITSLAWIDVKTIQPKVPDEIRNH